MIVMKFGGTSVESAEAIERAAAIVQTRLPRKPAVVVSAMGKTTNQLLAFAADAAAGRKGAAQAGLAGLRETHGGAANQLLSGQPRAEMDAFLDQHFHQLDEVLDGLSILGELTPRSADAIASFGERLSSAIVAAAFRERGLRSMHIDARQLIRTDRRHTQAAPLLEQTYASVRGAFGALNGAGVAVLGGFIGATEDGVTTTLGRGGSDFTAALVGAALGAEEIEIWTDVDGFLTCDPALVPEARTIKTMSFDEAAELAYFGAKVLHPATVIPARERNIPVRILNSRRPDARGTLVVAAAVPCGNVLKSVACKRNITVVNILSTRMLMAHGFLRRIFEVFDRHETPVDMLATSEVSVSLTIDNSRRLGEIIAELEPFAEVSVQKDRAIVCAVGESLRETPGVAARVFRALADVNICMISQGASHLNLGFVVAESDLRRAAGALHREFFSDLDPAVFD